jgi:hypothetical protein
MTLDRRNHDIPSRRLRRDLADFMGDASTATVTDLDLPRGLSPADDLPDPTLCLRVKFWGLLIALLVVVWWLHDTAGRLDAARRELAEARKAVPVLAERGGGR